MNDFTAALAPKSDQINAQDLLGGDMTITITGVKVTPGTEQPVSISFKESGKVWRPCKTTGRILMAAWGADTSTYAGRKVQLYLDEDVKWGGLKVGGIRIRAISHISEDLRIVLAESKQVRKPVTVKRLVAKQAQPAKQAVEYTVETALERATAKAKEGTDAFRAWFNTDDGKDCRATGALTPEAMLKLRKEATKADTGEVEDPFGLPPIDEVSTTATDTEILAQIERDVRAASEAEAKQYEASE